MRKQLSRSCNNSPGRQFPSISRTQREKTSLLSHSSGTLRSSPLQPHRLLPNPVQEPPHDRPPLQHECHPTPVSCQPTTSKNTACRTSMSQSSEAGCKPPLQRLGNKHSKEVIIFFDQQDVNCWPILSCHAITAATVSNNAPAS